jgi:hypothetical protein
LTASGPSSDDDIARGLAAFRESRFYEAHEHWEAVWRHSAGTERRLLQGLIQIAAACVHLEKGRPGPAGRLLVLSLEKLAEEPADFQGVPLDRLRAQARSLLEDVGGSPAPRRGTGSLRAPGSRRSE